MFSDINSLGITVCLGYWIYLDHQRRFYQEKERKEITIVKISWSCLIWKTMEIWLTCFCFMTSSCERLNIWWVTQSLCASCLLSCCKCFNRHYVSTSTKTNCYTRLIFNTSETSVRVWRALPSHVTKSTANTGLSNLILS